MLIKDWNENAQKVGGIISGFLHHEIFRQYLKSEVLKTFDGDYDVLLSKVVLDIKNGLPPVSRFTPLNEFFEAWQLAYLEQVAEGYPQMQLSVQTDPEQWTTPSFVPPVVFTPGDYDEASTTTVPVVDVNGNI
jgi:hypothetical protein